MSCHPAVEVRQRAAYCGQSVIEYARENGLVESATFTSAAQGRRRRRKVAVADMAAAAACGDLAGMRWAQVKFSCWKTPLPAYVKWIGDKLFLIDVSTEETLHVVRL